MSVELETPSLDDLRHVCANLCDDQVLEAVASSWLEEYDADQVAAIVNGLQGIKHVFRNANGEPYCAAGFVPVGPARCESWMLATPEWMNHAIEVTRVSRNVMHHILTATQFKRLQTVAMATRTHAIKWYATLGLEQEGILRSWGRRGEDFIMFSRIE